MPLRSQAYLRDRQVVLLATINLTRRHTRRKLIVDGETLIQIRKGAGVVLGETSVSHVSGLRALVNRHRRTGLRRRDEQRKIGVAQSCVSSFYASSNAMWLILTGRTFVSTACRVVMEVAAKRTPVKVSCPSNITRQVSRPRARRIPAEPERLRARSGRC